MNLITKKSLQSLTVGLFASVLALGLTSCEEVPNSPGFEFAPDMYRSPSLEYYGEYVNKAGDTLLASRLPVVGTISRNHLPGIAPGIDYEKSAIYLKNPLPFSEKVEKEGEDLYGKFCVHCHGDAGKGDGKVSAKLPGAPPAYDGPLKNLPEGKIFYSISNGKGLMGAHAPMLSVEERWKLVYYVQKLQGPKASASDSINVVIADSTKTKMPKTK